MFIRSRPARPRRAAITLMASIVLACAGFSITGSTAHAAPERDFSFPWPRQQEWYLTGAPHSYGGAAVLGSGLDFAPPADLSHRPVVAMADGRVTVTGTLPGFGNVVGIDHGDGWEIWYAHLASIAVEPGQHVLQGRYLGEAGATGYATGVHVHVELYYRGRHASWSDVTIEGWRPHRRWDYVGFLQRRDRTVWVTGYGGGGPLEASSPLILGCSPLDSEFAVNLVYWGYITGSADPTPCPPPNLTDEQAGGL